MMTMTTNQERQKGYIMNTNRFISSGDTFNNKPLQDIKFGCERSEQATTTTLHIKDVGMCSYCPTTHLFGYGFWRNLGVADPMQLIFKN